MITEAALTCFVAALFSMMNPSGNVGVFAGMTAGRPNDAPRIAVTSACAILVTLLVVTWAGSFMLRFFGITVDSLGAAGGVVVPVIGVHMLFNRGEHKSSSAEADDAGSRESIAIVPLAIPMVAGPGTMARVWSRPSNTRPC